MARVYADTTDLSEWTGDPLPNDPDRLLARASTYIDLALIGVRYATNEQGMPTSQQVAEALTDATCAQAQYWDELGDTGSGAIGVYSDVTIGSLSLSTPGGASAGAQGNGTTGGGGIAPRAYAVLRTAGLLPGYPLVRP